MRDALILIIIMVNVRKHRLPGLPPFERWTVMVENKYWITFTSQLFPRCGKCSVPQLTVHGTSILWYSYVYAYVYNI